MVSRRPCELHCEGLNLAEFSMCFVRETSGIFPAIPLEHLSAFAMSLWEMRQKLEIERFEGSSEARRERIALMNLLSSLDERRCVNDEAVNAYLKMLQDRNDDTRPRVFFFNCYFWKLLSGKGYYDFPAVSRYSERRSQASLKSCFFRRPVRVATFVSS